MEMKSPPTCPYTVTVRRNPPRRARPTPSSIVPPAIAFSSPSLNRDIPSFPVDEILSIEVSHNPRPETTSQPSSSSSSDGQSPPQNLKVFLRIRPPAVRQTTKVSSRIGAQPKNAWPKNAAAKNTSKLKGKRNSLICVSLNSNHSVTLRPPQHLRDLKRSKSEVFEGFSRVFSSESSQDEVYDCMVKPLVEDFLMGKSGMLAALGPSGSGKTHTVFGCPREPGMVPLALCQMFSGAQSARTFYLSMFEICTDKGKAERILDLLHDGPDLCMQQSMIKGLHEGKIENVEQAESLIANGMLKRSTAVTNSNSQSSRSQCVINIRNSPCQIDGGSYSGSAFLTIVDLAGAEREKRTGNQGTRLLEGNFINNTSMVFGLCLRSLLEHQKNPKKPLQKHYQNSLLTRYLRDYLEGKKRMTLILTVKPGEEDYLDSSFLLRQASPYTNIKYSNIEEPLNVISGKRQTQALPRSEPIKRIKVDREKCDEVHQHPKKDLEVFAESKKCTDGTLAAEESDELKKSERMNQIMQGFAKALWNTLKEYKKRLEGVEIEIENLRDCLSKEKARSSDLEHELNNMKSLCSHQKEASIGPSLTGVDACRFNLSLDLTENERKIVEVDTEVSSSSLQEDLEVSLDQKTREKIDIIKIPDMTADDNSTVGNNLCSIANSRTEEGHQVHENHSYIDIVEDSEGLMKKDALQCSIETTGPEISESANVISESLCSSSDDISSTVDIHQLQQENENSEEIVNDGKACAQMDGAQMDGDNYASDAIIPSKPFNAAKPKRRLLPASSMLLKDMGSFDIDDENEKHKGVGRERKVAADQIKRTQGSISLRLLLTNNLNS